MIAGLEQRVAHGLALFVQELRLGEEAELERAFGGRVERQPLLFQLAQRTLHRLQSLGGGRRVLLGAGIFWSAFGQSDPRHGDAAATALRLLAWRILPRWILAARRVLAGRILRVQQTRTDENCWKAKPRHSLDYTACNAAENFSV